uniref:Uncharacterized protein n=1 Tax=Glossina austeni TaxID=7395 RepID=A0A1A9VLT5_GLOAU
MYPYGGSAPCYGVPATAPPCQGTPPFQGPSPPAYSPDYSPQYIPHYNPHHHHHHHRPNGFMHHVHGHQQYHHHDGLYKEYALHLCLLDIGDNLALCLSAKTAITAPNLIAIVTN